MYSQIINRLTEPVLSKNSLAEKIYLQIDNTLYQTGETIWFKAIVSRSYDHSWSDISKILHVELIDINDKVIDHQLLKLNDGLANGSFVLEKSYEPGEYKIRAYTNWNRNFEQDFIFLQFIDVVNLEKDTLNEKPIINLVIGTGEYKSLQADINPRLVNRDFKGKLKLYIDTVKGLDSLILEETKNDIYKLDYQLPKDAIRVELRFNALAKQSIYKKEEVFYKETIIIDKDYLDIQFFPEGGHLVDRLLSTVAFKAIDYNGLGQKVIGKIKDNSGDDITTFSSNDLGMGTFKLLSRLDTSYYAEINKGQISYRYQLPRVRPNGSVITLANLRDKLRLSIVSNNQTSKFLTLKTSSRGVEYQNFSFGLKDTIITSIPKTSLPEGIVKISLLNDKNQKICERLVFNNRPEQRLKMNMVSDKVLYSQREEVRITLKVDSAQTNEPMSLSVLVLDKNRTETSRGYKPNILTYLLLNSELKGFIENPNYYFDESNRSRYIDLDALLLTQGWRNYNYQKEKPLTTFEYNPEIHLSLSGTIGEYFNPNKRPKTTLDLNLMIKDKIPRVYSLEIPESGKFRFQVDDIYKSNIDFFMQVVNHKGTPQDFKINLDKKWRPEIQKQSQTPFSIPSSIKTNFGDQMEVVNEIKERYETAFNTIALGEVNIKGYKLTLAREAFVKRHGEPTKILKGSDLNKNPPKWNWGLLSVIRARFPNEVIIKTVSIPHDPWLIPVVRGAEWPNGFTYVLVDNIPVALKDYGMIETIPVDEVVDIDILESPRNGNKYCSEVLRVTQCPTYTALINIYTKSGKGIYGMVKPKGYKVDKLQGFSEAIEFYAPNYETLSNQDWVIPDNRSVIHWSPNIELNAESEYLLEFYNDDYIGEVSVIVEAISKDGKIGYIEKTYTIKEAER
ncbi:MG2 domain-containing protein [Winogradskyella sp.]|uniref:MG2 domain-containing protein n=1 Tax=Winogradskyella sp. TaxID=1883156 RepID=UPI00262DD01A|nr:MG2 domain-containing protein [Winogradskyella sp.]